MTSAPGGCTCGFLQGSLVRQDCPLVVARTQQGQPLWLPLALYPGTGPEVLVPVAFAELVNPTAGIEHFLLAGVERMALRADFNREILANS